MKTPPEQKLSSSHQEPGAEQTVISISRAQLGHIAELLDILDQFLRHSHSIAYHLADYLHTTGRDQAQPPGWVGYDANLLIDQVSFTAHSLRAHRREPLR